MTAIRSILLASVAAVVFAKADAATGSESPTTDAPESTALVFLFDEDKVKKIKTAMNDYEVFDSVDLAAAKLEKAMAATENFFGLPVQVKGLKEDGTIDSDLYAGQRACLAYITAKGSAKDDKSSGIKGVLLFPVPTVEQFMATDAGKQFIDKVTVKEVRLVAFRQVRDSTSLYDFTSGMERIPSNADEYATESRRGGIDTDTFDALWAGFKTALKDRKPEHYAALPQKKQFLDALRSADYARNTDETRAFEEGGWFAKYAELLIGAAANNKNPDTGAPEPLDSSALKDWLANRDTLILEREGAKPKDYSKLGSAADFDLGM
jgi:hypothetical protein